FAFDYLLVPVRACARDGKISCNVGECCAGSLPQLKVRTNPMPSESTDVKFEIGHVLFIDIVGYSKLLIDQQSELQRQLSEIVRETDQFRAAKKSGKLIRLPRGDGIALVFFNTVEAPVQCALEISKALLDHPKLKVRMGVNSGPISRVRDVDDRPDVAGAGINKSSAFFHLRT